MVPLARECDPEKEHECMCSSLRNIRKLAPTLGGPAFGLILWHRLPCSSLPLHRKGVNRVLGTLCAGLVALVISHVNDHLSSTVAPIFTVLFVFVGGAIPMYYRFRPPFKDRCACA